MLIFSSGGIPDEKGLFNDSDSLAAVARRHPSGVRACWF